MIKKIEDMDDAEYFSYKKKCNSLVKEMNLQGSVLDGLAFSPMDIIQFLQDEEKLKRALFILKHPELL